MQAKFGLQYQPSTGKSYDTTVVMGSGLVTCHLFRLERSLNRNLQKTKPLTLQIHSSSRLRNIQAVFSCTSMRWVSTSALG